MNEPKSKSELEENLLRAVVEPFLREVWPQERSLASPGVSHALAQIPAETGDDFARAVNSIERFLVPFECWSMFEYGLWGGEDDDARLSSIDTQEKATAFLRLLDLTVGTSERDVVPDDIAEALDQIRKVAPDLAGERAFRRLSAAARR